MIKSNSIRVRALYLSVPIFLVMLTCELILDYKNDGSINGSLSEGEGYFWVFLVLGPAILVGLPWSLSAVVVFPLMAGIQIALGYFGFQVTDSAVNPVLQFLFHVAIFVSLFVNGMIIAGRRKTIGLGSVLASLAFVYVLIPLLLLSVLFIFRWMET